MWSSFTLNEQIDVIELVLIFSSKSWPESEQQHVPQRRTFPLQTGLSELQTATVLSRFQRASCCHLEQDVVPVHYMLFVSCAGLTVNIQRDLDIKHSM